MIRNTVNRVNKNGRFVMVDDRKQTFGKRKIISRIVWGNLLFIGVAVVLVLSWTRGGYDSSVSLSSPSSLRLVPTTASASALVDSQKVYDIVSTTTATTTTDPQQKKPPPEFEFLDFVDMSITTTTTANTSKQYNVQPRPYFRTLNDAHLEGLVHTGVWIYVTAFSSKNSGDLQVLLLKRGPQLVTCPNMWGLVGEHTNGDETPEETVQRALMEELWGGTSTTTGSTPVDDGTTATTTSTVALLDSRVALVRNITEHPVYYLRDYGPSRQHRIDRQITYLYEVRMRHTSDQVILALDDEVADHQWISLDDYRKWMHRDVVAATTATTTTTTTTKNLIAAETTTTTTTEEEYDAQDFCHSTILQLGQFSLERLVTTIERDN